jgi:cation:H+ antiporter
LARRAAPSSVVLTEAGIITPPDRQPERRFQEALWFNTLLVLLGLCLLVLGSRFFVSAAIRLAHTMGISELVIGLTVVAVGTSLPELVTSVVAARRGNADLAIGNVLGSNIFNLLGILGVASLLRPQVVEAQVARIDVPFMLLGMLALLPIMKSDGVISRREGAALLGSYAVYLLFLFLRAR